MNTTPLWEKLSIHFSEEMERHETMLSVCITQGEAMRRHDFTLLQEMNESLGILQDEAAGSAVVRDHLLHQAAQQLQLNPDNITLSQLIQAAPPPWKFRLLEVQQGIRHSLEEIHRISQENNFTIRYSMRVVDRALQQLQQCIDMEAAYDARGEDTKKAVGMGPTVLDSRG